MTDRASTTPRGRFLRHLLSSAVVILGVSLLTLLLEEAGLLDRFETTGLDAFNVARSARDPSDIVIVGILDEDYTTLFNETSPLDCARLKEIIGAIAAGNPTVIGVDLDTASRPQFECLAGAQGWTPPVVWAADATWDKDKKTFAEIPVLAGHGPAGQDSHGIAVLPQDSDGVIRRYDREVPIAEGRRARSFAWAVIEAACKRECEACCHAQASESHEEGLRLNFAGERFAFRPLSVQAVLDAAAERVNNKNESVWGTHGLLTKKIVLLGGAYRQARDTQFTPVGPMLGVQINAQAIESELHGGGIRSLQLWQAFGLDVLAGFALVLVNHRLRAHLTAALAVSLLLIPVFCLAASYAAFSAFSLWFNFIPVVVSVIIHEFWEHAREYQRLAAAHGQAG